MARGSGGTPFGFRSRTVGALPIVGAFLDRLGIETMLEDEPATDPRAQLSVAQSLGVLLRNVVCEWAPLFALGKWVATHDEVALGLGLLKVPHSAYPGTHLQEYSRTQSAPGDALVRLHHLGLPWAMQRIFRGILKSKCS